MNLIALLIGLVIERLATQIFHWRRMRWMDRIIDFGFRQAERLNNWPAIIPVLLLGIVLILPVFAVIWFLGSTLAGFTYLLLAVVVLFFSLGPRDIGEEVGEYCRALESDDEEQIGNAAKAIVEGDVPEDPSERTSCVEAAVCVQANNRLFAVVFWFMVLGPAGAWLFRVADLMRRRAVFEAGRKTSAGAAVPGYLQVVQSIYGLFAWVPARLLALGYAMAGSFEEAVSDWRTYYETCSDKFFHVNDAILAAAGRGALREEEKEAETFPLGPVRAAMKLVRRTLLVWVTVISLLTVAGQVA